MPLRQHRFGYVPWLQAESRDMPLDAVLNEDGVAWHRPEPEPPPEGQQRN
jgi:hypothetical protein